MTVVLVSANCHGDTVCTTVTTTSSCVFNCHLSLSHPVSLMAVASLPASQVLFVSCPPPPFFLLSLSLSLCAFLLFLCVREREKANACMNVCVCTRAFLRSTYPCVCGYLSVRRYVSVMSVRLLACPSQSLHRVDDKSRCDKATMTENVRQCVNISLLKHGRLAHPDLKWPARAISPGRQVEKESFPHTKLPSLRGGRAGPDSHTPL